MWCYIARQIGTSTGNLHIEKPWHFGHSKVGASKSNSHVKDVCGPYMKTLEPIV